MIVKGATGGFAFRARERCIRIGCWENTQSEAQYDGQNETKKGLNHVDFTRRIFCTQLTHGEASDEKLNLTGSRNLMTNGLSVIEGIVFTFAPRLQTSVLLFISASFPSPVLTPLRDYQASPSMT